MILPKEQVDKNEAPSLRSPRPPREEQEASAEEFAQASNAGDRLAVLSTKCQPHQILGVERQEQEAPLLKLHLFLLCAMTVVDDVCANFL